MARTKRLKGVKFIYIDAVRYMRPKRGFNETYFFLGTINAYGCRGKITEIIREIKNCHLKVVVLRDKKGRKREEIIGEWTEKERGNRQKEKGRRK